MPTRECDRTEHLVGNGVLVLVAHGASRFHDRSAGHSVGDVIGLTSAHLRKSEQHRKTGLSVLAINADGDLAESCGDGHGRLLHERDGGRPADGNG